MLAVNILIDIEQLQKYIILQIMNKFSLFLLKQTKYLHISGVPEEEEEDILMGDVVVVVDFLLQL